MTTLYSRQSELRGKLGRSDITEKKKEKISFVLWKAFL
jgi:hypothetical protein